MRVLHVLETLAAGGVETTFLHVLRHLQKDGMVHDVLAFSGGALESEYRSAASRVLLERHPPALERIVTNTPYDVAHVLFERCAERLLPVLLTRTATRVVYGKNYDFSGQWRSTEGFISHADAAMLDACDGVTFTSAPLAASYGDVARRGPVLGKGADVTPLMTIEPPEPGLGNRILAVANPTPRKRLGDLIAALVLIRNRIPDVHLRIVGQGDAHEVARLKQQAERAGIDRHITFVGGSRDVAGELRRARVFALSSGSEGIPTVVLEAMAAARPVVVTGAGHVRSILEDGVEGYVVDVGDVAGLAERLIRVLRDRALAREMGERGRVRASSHRVETIAARLAAYFREVAA